MRDETNPGRKDVSGENSKAFLDRRQSETAERLDPSWQPVRDKPVLEGGNIVYEVAGRTKAVICGGLGMLQEVVKASGLRSAIDGTLKLLARRKPYHESDHVLALVFNILAGGRCINDLERQRQNLSFLDALGARRIPGATTAAWKRCLARYGLAMVRAEHKTLAELEMQDQIEDILITLDTQYHLLNLVACARTFSST